MASRKKLTRVTKQRTGLRSQRQQQEENATAKSERAWETEDDDEDRSWVPPAAPTASGSTSEPGGELLSLMKDFLSGQQRREEFLFAELRDLRTSVPVGNPFPQSDSDSEPDQPTPEWRHYAEPKIPQYQCGEDIENYLLRFERIAKTWR
ncbi:Vesicular inhibitory amino acid transporter [Dissostichus eleginoides]|uniref:Vesicular inhibitory amino acid transporter n=1 Tax=Dissostichus eleginoides TaxID=100907 RepID=A0AAD9CMF9_DISEL|nr:Vesicular inhibitory amino acid transporter [Dissostichus eleginoides]